MIPGLLLLLDTGVFDLAVGIIEVSAGYAILKRKTWAHRICKKVSLLIILQILISAIISGWSSVYAIIILVPILFLVYLRQPHVKRSLFVFSKIDGDSNNPLI